MTARAGGDLVEKKIAGEAGDLLSRLGEGRELRVHEITEG